MRESDWPKEGNNAQDAPSNAAQHGEKGRFAWQSAPQQRLPVIAPQQSYTRHCPSTPIATQIYHSTKIATQTLNKEIAT